MKKGVTIALILVAIVIGYYLISPVFRDVEINEPLSDDNSISNISGEALFQGPFTSNAHDVQGNARVVEVDGKNILRFEDFETINGPNLHIYLSSDLEANDFIDLGAIKATKGNINYDLPEGVDLTKYNKVLIWCVPFRILFSHAKLG